MTSSRILSGIIMLLGLTMVVSAFARGGGALALGVVLGTMLALLGAGRLWLARRGGGWGPTTTREVRHTSATRRGRTVRVRACGAARRGSGGAPSALAS